jgi:hypothetical protein
LFALDKAKAKQTDLVYGLGRGNVNAARKRH